MARYIHHVTLTTGACGRSWRHEISPEAMHVVAAMLDAVLVEREVGIPATDPPCTVSVTAEGRCMIATVYGPDYQRMRTPLATFGVAAKARCGAPLWRVMHHHAVGVIATREDERPNEPWCAVRLEPGIAIHESAAHWLGDFERCLAWAWLDHIERKD